MPNNPIVILRKDLARISDDQRVIKAFEELFELIPSQLYVLDISAESARSDANSALSSLIALTGVVGIDALKAMPANSISPQLDSVIFNKYPSLSEQVGQLSYSVDEDSLSLLHENSLNQDIGLALMMRCDNNSGSTIEKGSVVGKDGSNGARLDIRDVIADGTFLSQEIYGVTPNSIEDGGVGFVVVFGNITGMDSSGTPYGEVWADGDFLYLSSSISGGLTNVRPGAPNISVQIGVVVKADESDGIIFVNPIIQDQNYYGLLTKTTDATALAIDTAYALEFDNELESNGISLDPGNPTQIIFDYKSFFMIQVSVQLASLSAALKKGYIWIRKNGVDVDFSSTISTLSNTNEIRIHTFNFMLNMDSGDYIEIMWAVNDTNLKIDSSGATAFSPESSACIVSITKINQ